MTQVQWEYRTVKVDVAGWLTPKLETHVFDAQLDELGREGWELVNVMDLNMGHGASFALVAVFKRPLAR